MPAVLLVTWKQFNYAKKAPTPRCAASGLEIVVPEWELLVEHGLLNKVKNVFAVSLHALVFLLTSGMRHPKYLVRSKRGLMACCSSVRNRVFVSFC